MGKTKKDKAETQAPADNMTAAMMAMSPSAAKAWFDIMTECSRFMMERLEQDMETQRAFLNCKSPTELLQLQTRFYQTALQQYSDQTMRVLEMMSDAAGTSGIAPKSGSRRRYDDIPL